MAMFHRATRLISSNHYQAPVRRFILDLFDIAIDGSTIEELLRLDLEQSYGHNPRRRSTHRSSGAENSSNRRNRDGALGPDDRRERDKDQHEARRRSASSPGPPPPGKVKRERGLTISEIRSGRSKYEEEDE